MRPGLSVPAASAEASGVRLPVANPGIPGLSFPPFVSEVVVNEIRAGTWTREWGDKHRREATPS